jgi:hypothetical protein
MAEGLYVRRLPVVLVLLFGGGAASCLQLTGSELGDAGAAPTPASSADAAAGPTGVTGTACALDSVSGVTLCTTIDLCPSLVVDHDLYPDCGFRVPGLSIDLECVCGDFLCAMGTALRCSQARDLLSQSSELAVCARQADGQCAARSPSKPAQSGCDRTCALECAGDPGCWKLCGC